MNQSTDHTHISPNVSPCQVVWPRFRSRRSATGARREAAADRGGPPRARDLGKAVPWRCSTVCGVVCGVLGRSPHESWLWLPGLVNLQKTTEHHHVYFAIAMLVCRRVLAGILNDSQMGEPENPIRGLTNQGY